MPLYKVTFLDGKEEKIFAKNRNILDELLKGKSIVEVSLMNKPVVIASARTQDEYHEIQGKSG